MMKIIILAFISCFLLLNTCSKKDIHGFSISVKNPLSQERLMEPVEIDISELNLDNDVKGVFILTCDEKIHPFQIDDLNGDQVPDEISFLCNLQPNEEKNFSLTYSKNNIQEPISFENKTWAQLMLKEDMEYKSSLSALGGNLYQECYHHGPAFENDEIAYRVYFDRRMSIDVYGKKTNKLELKQTNWYSDSIQRNCGFGKDILWVGKTASIGAVRAWNGEKATFLMNVDTRTSRIVAYGPVRTIVEMNSIGWKSENDTVDVKSIFTLYSGHREFRHDVEISKDSVPLCTGLMKKDEARYFHANGIEGLWGFNIAEQKEQVADTFGLGVVIPEKYILEKAEDNLNHLRILNSTKFRNLTWYGIATWNQETGGYKDQESFFTYLEELKEVIDHPVTVSIKKI